MDVDEGGQSSMMTMSESQKSVNVVLDYSQLDPKLKRVR